MANITIDWNNFNWQELGYVTDFKYQMYLSDILGELRLSPLKMNGVGDMYYITITFSTNAKIYFYFYGLDKNNQILAPKLRRNIEGTIVNNYIDIKVLNRPDGGTHVKIFQNGNNDVPAYDIISKKNPINYQLDLGKVTSTNIIQHSKTFIDRYYINGKNKGIDLKNFNDYYQRSEDIQSYYIGVKFNNLNLFVSPSRFLTDKIYNYYYHNININGFSRLLILEEDKFLQLSNTDDNIIFLGISKEKESNKSIFNLDFNHGGTFFVNKYRNYVNTHNAYYHMTFYNIDKDETIVLNIVLSSYSNNKDFKDDLYINVNNDVAPMNLPKNKNLDFIGVETFINKATNIQYMHGFKLEDLKYNRSKAKSTPIHSLRNLDDLEDLEDTIKFIMESESTKFTKLEEENVKYNELVNYILEISDTMENIIVKLSESYYEISCQKFDDLYSQFLDISEEYKIFKDDFMELMDRKEEYEKNLLQQKTFSVANKFIIDNKELIINTSDRIRRLVNEQSSIKIKFHKLFQETLNLFSRDINDKIHENIKTYNETVLYLQQTAGNTRDELWQESQNFSKINEEFENNFYSNYREIINTPINLESLPFTTNFCNEILERLHNITRSITNLRRHAFINYTNFLLESERKYLLDKEDFKILEDFTVEVNMKIKILNRVFSKINLEVKNINRNDIYMELENLFNEYKNIVQTFYDFTNNVKNINNLETFKILYYQADNIQLRMNKINDILFDNIQVTVNNLMLENNKNDEIENISNLMMDEEENIMLPPYNDEEYDKLLNKISNIKF